MLLIFLHLLSRKFFSSLSAWSVSIFYAGKWWFSRRLVLGTSHWTSLCSYHLLICAEQRAWCAVICVCLGQSRDIQSKRNFKACSRENEWLILSSQRQQWLKWQMNEKTKRVKRQDRKECGAQEKVLWFFFFVPWTKNSRLSSYGICWVRIHWPWL